jgi:hypothetical protein
MEVETKGSRVNSRVARIRPTYEEWYPKITPGVWHNAAWLAEMVLQQQRRGSPRWVLEGRPLADAHFEFQGYGPPQGTSHRRRQLAGSESDL